MLFILLKVQIFNLIHLVLDFTLGNSLAGLNLTNNI